MVTNFYSTTVYMNIVSWIGFLVFLQAVQYRCTEAEKCGIAAET